MSEGVPPRWSALADEEGTQDNLSLDSQREAASSGTGRAAVLLTEARREYEMEVQSLQDADRKAAGVLRTSLLLVGILLSALGLTGFEVLLELSPITITSLTFGTLLITASAFFAIATMSWSRYPSGVGDEMRNVMLQKERSTFVVNSRLMYQYQAMLEETVAEVEWNSSMLGQSQGFLFTGVVIILGAIGYAVVNQPLADGLTRGIVYGVVAFIVFLLGVRIFITPRSESKVVS